LHGLILPEFPAAAYSWGYVKSGSENQWVHAPSP
jgi:hypothetical protein